MGAVASPGRTTQRMVALERANEVRTSRKELKQWIAAREILPSEVITGPPAFALSMAVWDVLVAAPKVGFATARRLLNRAGLSHSRQICALTRRQRDELVRVLRAAGL